MWTGCPFRWHVIIVVADRRAQPIEKKDLLTNMISGSDPKTGQGLSDDNITNNVRPFLLFSVPVKAD